MRLVTLALLALSGCDGGSTEPSSSSSAGEASSAASDAEDVGEVVATVGGLSVSQKDFEQAAARVSPADGKALSDEEKREVIDKLVEEKILYLEALSQGLDKDPKVQKVMVNTLLREEVYAKVRNSDFTDDELQAYYTEHVDEFVVPEKVQVKRILIRVNDDRPEPAASAEAERLRQEVVADTKAFKELATTYSEGPYKRRGGDLGFVSSEGKPGVDEAIVEKAFGMEVGQVSEVFRTDEGYNVIYIANKRDKVERTFQQMKGSVLRKLKNDRLQDMYETYVDGLEGTVSVDVDEAKLAAIEIASSARPSLRPGLPGMPNLPGADGGEAETPELRLKTPDEISTEAGGE